MPEFPEIAARAAEMNELLTGKTITAIEVLQPKCLNVPEERFTASLAGATLGATTQRGKWLANETTQGWLLLNLGMGGEILLSSSTSPTAAASRSTSGGSGMRTTCRRDRSKRTR